MDEMQLLRSLDPARAEQLDDFPASVVLEELVAQLVTLPLETSKGSGPLARLRPQSHSHRQFFIRSLLAVAAAAAVIIAAVVAGLSGPHLPKGSYTTPWQPTGPASSTAVPASSHASLGPLRLVSYLADLSWRVTHAPRSSNLTCPTVSACYIVTWPTGNGSSQVYFSGDGGARWSSLKLPRDLVGLGLTRLSCPGAGTCAGAGWLARKGATEWPPVKPVFISTTDGGHRWTVLPLALPGARGLPALSSPTVMMLSCSSASVCDGVSEVCPEPGMPTMCLPSASSRQAFVRTTDGGATWSVTRAFPSGAEIYALACPGTDECVATGSYHEGPPSRPSDFAMVSTDGGRHWRQGRFLGGPTAGSLTALSCADVSYCTAVSVFNSVTPAAPALSAPPGPFCPQAGCTSLDPNIATTVDGGKTWRLRAFPESKWIRTPAPPGAAAAPATGTAIGATGPNLIALVCSFAGNCQPEQVFWWLSGPPTFPTSLLTFPQWAIGLDCPVARQCWLATPWHLLSTTNGGRTWSAPQLPPAGPLQSFLVGVASVSCPAVGQCVALGYPNSLSAPVPVYSSIRVGHR